MYFNQLFFVSFLFQHQQEIVLVFFLVLCVSDSPEKCERLVLPLSLSASSGRFRESFGISGLGHVVSIPASAAIICIPKRIQFSVDFGFVDLLELVSSFQ